MKTFADLGIDVDEGRGGNQKIICPQCSNTRKKKTDPCLSVNIDEGIYYCHHCEWNGSLSNGNGSGSNHPAKVIYDYCDEKGNVLYQKVRTFPKNFWFQKPDGGKLSGVRRVLYRLPELINSTGQVFIVGGEKDVETLRNHDLISTTNDNGEGHWRPEFNQFLKDREVVILEDNDEKGRKHGKIVSQQLRGIAKSIRVIKFLELNKGGDVTDFLASHSVDDLLKRVEASEREGMEWQEQQPLYRPLPESDPYPVDALGNVLGGAVEAMSEIIQAPQAICANSILASATLAIQGHVNVVIDGRVHPTSNFFISIGESGERKSAVDYQALKPHYDYQEELRITHKEELKVYHREAEAYKKAKDDVLKKTKGYDEKLRAIENLGDEPISPLQPFIVSEEPTYEGLVKSLELGQASQGLFSDEGGRFIGGHGMNSDNALKTASGLSGLWDGKPISRMRAGDGSSLLVGRRLSLHLMVQPNIAQMILSNSMLIEQGLLSRCLCVYPKSTAGTRKYKPIDLNESQPIRAYRDRISEILHTPYRTGDAENELQPHQVELDWDAKQVWRMFHDKVEEQLSEYGSLSTIRGFGNKAPEHALRLATVLAGFDVRKISNFSGISNGYIRNSTILTQYYLNEHLRLFNSGTADPVLQDANKLLEWLRTERKKVVTLPEIYQYGPNSIRDARKARNLMEILVEHGYARQLNDGAEFQGKVRKEAYEVRA